jgi:hypothetical protein
MSKRLIPWRGFASLFRRLPLSGLIVPNASAIEKIEWRPVWTREIFNGASCFADTLHRLPSDRLVVDGNLLLNAGINEMWQLICGATAVAYNNANANIAVGNSNTAASASQTDLQGGSIARAGMESSFPSITNQTATWKSSFGTSAANFNWLEVSLQNGEGTPSDPVFAMNRKQQDFGTKVSGSTWTMQLAITLS